MDPTRLRLGYRALVLAAGLLVHGRLAAEPARLLKVGWYSWYPYQYQENLGGAEALTGLDVELVRAAFGGTGVTVSYRALSWAEQLEAVRTGGLDVASGAVRTPEREEYAFFSAPYRKETVVLYSRTGEAMSFADVPDMLAKLARSRLRLGIVEGFDYGPGVRAAIQSGALDTRPVGTDAENFGNLLSRQIDGLLVDRMAGALLEWQHGWHALVEPNPLVVHSTDVHVIFSKKTVAPEVVRLFDERLSALQKNGDYAGLMGHYRVPVVLSLLSSAVSGRWFLVINVVGIVAFAISGLLLARKERYDIFGAFVLSVLPAVGGGVVRDLLVNRRPIFILRTPIYLLAVTGTVVLGYLAFKLHDRLRPEPAAADPLLSRRPGRDLARIGRDLVEVFDALGLGAFTVVGVFVAIEMRAEPLLLWGPCLAALTGAGGGILRDVVRADASSPGLKGSFYAEVAVVWGLLLSLFLSLQGEGTGRGVVLASILVTMFGAFATRLLAIALGIRSPFVHDGRLPDEVIDRDASG